MADSVAQWRRDPGLVREIAAISETAAMWYHYFVAVMKATVKPKLEYAVMAVIDDLRSWFERDLRFASWDENVKTDIHQADKLDIRFYTETNEYLLAISVSGPDGLEVEATAKPRKARAGQDTTSVRPLLASRRPLNEATWRRILARIVGLELVRVHRDKVERSDGSTRIRRGAMAARISG